MIEVTNDTTNFVFILDNPILSRIDQIWLVDKGVCERNDFNDPQTIILPDLKQVFGSQYQLQIMVNRLTLSAIGSQDEKSLVFRKKIQPFLDDNQLLSVKAMGVNFTWLLSPANNFDKISRSLFYKEDNPIAQFFSSEDSRYGSYLSTNYNDLRLKVTITPVKKTAPEGKEALHALFNYHLDLNKNDDINSIITKHINNWVDYDKYIQKMVDVLSEEMEKKE